MRYDAEHKQKTRERVLKAAAHEIRRHGAQGVGVAQVMARAGLTHGGFYAHFSSREELISEGVAQMFRDARKAMGGDDDLPPGEALTRYVDFYLSAAHRDTLTRGCPLPFLSADAPRLAPDARARFAQGMAGLEERLAGQLKALGRADPAADASSLLAEMVGALTLARAEPDKARSDLMLERSRDAVRRRFDV